MFSHLVVLSLAVLFIFLMRFVVRFFLYFNKVLLPSHFTLSSVKVFCLRTLLCFNKVLLPTFLLAAACLIYCASLREAIDLGRLALPSKARSGKFSLTTTFDGAHIMRCIFKGTAPDGAASINQPSRGGLRRVQTVVPNRRTGARRLRDERGVMGIVKGM